MSNWWFRSLWCSVVVGVLAVLIIFFGKAAQAQVVYGQIQGTVVDSTGGNIPGATITVTDPSKGTTVTATSNAAGEFTVDHLVPDTYNIKVTANGFATYQQNGLLIFADTAATVHAALQVGSQTTTVEVNADAVPQLKTDRADVAMNFSSRELESLPIPDHNFTNLQLLLPGATELGWAHAADENPQGSKQIQVDGQAFGGVNYTLDGTDNQDPILGIIVINPNSDSMTEAKIATQNYDAEFGKAVSSVQSVQTKSGSNAFHGTLFDNRESNANLARDPFSQPKSSPFPGGLKNQFGGSLGGPIWRDHAFFFGDYQGVRQKVGTAAKETVPTQNVLKSCLGQITPVVNGVLTPGCDFSEYTSVGAGHVLYNNTGATVNGVPNGAAWPGNVIPAVLISPTAMNLFKLLLPYAPNINQAGLTDNYAASGTGIFNSDEWDVRGDVNATQKIHAFGRFSRFTDTLTGKTLFGNAGGSGFGISGYGGTSNGANDSVALGADIFLSTKWSTDVRLGYYRYNVITAKYDQTANNLPIQGENVSGTGINAPLVVTQQFGAPNINVADLNISGNNGPTNAQNDGAQYGSGLNVNRCNCPLIQKEDQFQLVNNWTRVIGTHEVKFGIDLRYARNLRVPSDNDRTGNNNFGSGPTSNGNGGTGLGFATYVLGDVTAFNRYIGTPSETNAKEFQPRDFFYGQDTWRVTPKLTVNIGLRYEYYAPERVNAAGNGALLNLDTGWINVAGEGGIPLNMGVAAPKFPFNPRLGIAYSFNNNTVLRAGYGRSFDLGVFGSVFGHTVTQNLPVLINQAVTQPGNYASYAFSLDNPIIRTANVAGLTNYQPVAPNGQGQIAMGGPNSPIVPGSGGLTVGQFVDEKARPYTERLTTLDAWNVAIQRSLGPTISVTLAYVGNKGTHTLSDGDGNNTNPNEAAIMLPAQYSSIKANGSQIALHYDQLNQKNPDGSPGPIPQYCSANPGNCIQGVPTAGPYQGATNSYNLLRRYVGGSLPACGGPCNITQDIQYNGDNQNTHYNAFQATVDKRVSHGLNFSLNYAYQHALSANSAYATWNVQAVTGNDSNLRRSSFTAYGLYRLPFGRDGDYMKDVNAWVNGIIGGWEFSPTVFWQSGLPFNITYSQCGTYLPSDAPCYPNGPASGLKYNLQGTPGTPNGVFMFRGVLPPNAPASANLCNTPGYGFTCPGLDTIGNTGRNTGWGPGLFNSDMSIIKNVMLYERWALQFRMDAFNALNHINYGSPNGQIDAAYTSAGQITGGPFPNGSNPRQLQFTARVQF